MLLHAPLAVSASSPWAAWTASACAFAGPWQVSQPLNVILARGKQASSGSFSRIRRFRSCGSPCSARDRQMHWLVRQNPARGWRRKGPGWIPGASGRSFRRPGKRKGEREEKRCARPYRAQAFLRMAGNSFSSPILSGRAKKTITLQRFAKLRDASSKTLSETGL